MSLGIESAEQRDAPSSTENKKRRRVRSVGRLAEEMNFIEFLRKAADSVDAHWPGLMIVLVAMAASMVHLVCHVNPANDKFTAATESSAVAVARAAWSRKYGSGAVEQYEPYYAKLHAGIWTVFGTMPKKVNGAMLRASICESDGVALVVDRGRK